MISIVESALGVYNINQLMRFRNCGKLYIGLKCSGCGRPVVVPLCCKLRVCPECSRKIASQLFRRYLPILKSLMKSGVLSLLTLTIRNVFNMKIGIDKLKKCISEFLKKNYVRKRIVGGLYAIEVKEDEYGWYNIHVHFLIVHKWFGKATPSEIRHLRIPSRLQGIVSKDNLTSNSHLCINGKKVATGQVILSIFWEQISGDYVVDIRRIRSPKGGLRYVLKYVLKPPSFSRVESYVEFLKAFEHKPRVVPIGEMRGVEIKKHVLSCPCCGTTSFIFVKLLFEDEIDEFLALESDGGS